MMGSLLKERLLNTTVLAGFAAAFVMSVPTIAFAQEDEPDVEADEPTVEEIEEEEGDERMLVTGSRIQAPTFGEFQPTITIDREFADRRGYIDLADALNELPTITGSTDDIGAQSAFGAGGQFIDILGLGTARTLTLVNGRRFVSANQASLFSQGDPGLQVDISVIPTAAIERTDVVTVGGAPTYGTDAVAGTVNVILRDDFEGFDLDILGAVTETGLADQFRVRGIWGASSTDGRGNVFASVEYNKQGGVLSNELPGPSRQCFVGAPNPSADGPAGVTICDRTVPAITFGGTIFGNSTTLLQFLPNGDLAPVDLGDPVSTLTIAGGGDGLNLADVSQVLTDQERFLFYSAGHYELVPRKLRLFYEANFADLESTEIANQPQFNFVSFGGEAGSITFPLDNPFLSDQALGVLADEGLDQVTIVGRANTDILNNNPNSTDLFQFRIVTGAQGEFDLLERSFDWELSFNFGSAESFNETLNILDLNFLLALDAVVDPASGEIVCRTSLPGEAPEPGAVNAPDFAAGGGNFEITQEAIEQCVPINLFGNGAPSPEATDFVTGVFGTSGKNTQTDVLGFVRGDIFDLPAGPVSAVAGFEYRRERASFDTTAAGEFALSSAAPFVESAGSFDVVEGYFEARVPIFSPEMGIFGIHSLEINGGVRHTRNSITGNDFIWTAGGTWSPIEDITLRGNRTRSIRAPSTLELFLGSQPSFQGAADPCDITNIDTGPSPATRRANCEAAVAALGLPADFLDTFISDATQFTIPGAVEGNSGLDNETADSYTVGVILQPRFVPGLTINVDYVDIVIADAIDTLSLTAATELCFDQPGFPNEFSDSFIRDDAFQIVDFTTGFFNVAEFSLETITGGIQYAFEVSDAFDLMGRWTNWTPGIADLGSVVFGGTFRLDLERTEQETPTAPVESILDEINDADAAPRQNYQFNVNYFYKNFDFLLQANILGDRIFDDVLTPADQDILEVESIVRINMSAGYNFGEHVRLQATVTNVLDTEPPFPLNGLGAALDDPFGRRYTGRLTVRF